MNQKVKYKQRYLPFVLLLILYAALSYFVPWFARSDRVLDLGWIDVPFTVFTGVCSSIANILIIFLAVYYGKLGFIVSLVVLILQFPAMIKNMTVLHSTASIPGFFGIIVTIVVIVVIYRRNRMIARLQEEEVAHLTDRQQFSQHLFEQTVTALVNAVDAKDTYSHGHSLRVAEYSQKIAKKLGKNDEECNRIYYTALLHDVGKIGITDSIINKDGKLTPEEYEVIKQHPIMGNQILSSISEYPYLSIGAHYHHEHYDGKGYPDGLKGEDIPEIARIISVADAYDAMTSNRSYRNAIPQQLVREEIVKCAGTQFDPKIAKVMQQLIDEDAEYKLKERTAVNELAGRNELVCEEYRSAVSDGILVTQNITHIHLCFRKENAEDESRNVPALILFDSLDARVHDDEVTAEDLSYYEYCEIFLDGSTTNSGVRKIETSVSPLDELDGKEADGSVIYDIEAVKCKDHVLVKIKSKKEIVEVTVALPDNTRFVYIGLTGENCSIDDVSIIKDEAVVADDYIPRIAEEISYIDGPVGDIPNLQVNGFRTEATRGILIRDGLKITFHTKSLPTARLIWHCPYLDVFYSKDAQIGGPDFREYALIRLDGENWECEQVAVNKLTINRGDDFESWDAWKKANKEGYDCEVNFSVKDNKYVTTTENFGLSIRNSTTVLDGTEKLYVALTGDQCALTNIRIQ